MSDEQTKTRKRPDFTVYFIEEREGCPWVPVGAAWTHGDGDGFNLKLSLLPNVPGRLVLRKPKDKAEAEGGQ